MRLTGILSATITRQDRPRHMGEIFTLTPDLPDSEWTNSETGGGAWVNIAASAGSSVWLNIADSMLITRPLSAMRLFGKVDAQVNNEDRPHPMGEIFVITPGTTAPWTNISGSTDGGYD